MDDREFELFMKQLGDKIKAAGGTYVLNPAAVDKASRIMKKLNEIKAADTDNDYEIDIGFDVEPLLSHTATIVFNFESYGFVRKQYESVFEIIKLADCVRIVPGYKSDTTTVSFMIDNYVIRYNNS